MWKLVEKLNTNATCHNLNKERSGRQRTARTQSNINAVTQSLQQNGRRSARRNGCGVSPSSFCRIVKEINFHPFVLVKRQKLKPEDPAKRVTFFNRFLQTIHRDPIFLNNLISSDEAIFCLNAEVNSLNV